MSEPADRPAPAVGRPTEDPAVLFEQLWRLGKKPDVREFLRQAGSLAPAQVVAVLCVDQWERWQIGERIPAEAHLQMHPNLVGVEEAFDLVFGEVLLREDREETPTLEEYLHRFPQYAAQLKKQFDFHRAIQSESLVRSLEGGAEPAQAKPAPVAQSQDNDSSAIITATPPKPVEASWPTIPGYEILGELGRGGMGQVFKARHLRLKRVVALKVIRQERLSQDPEAVRRFQREARAAAQLSHPNVVVVYDLDEVDGHYFIAMEYVEGVDLFEYVKESGPLSVEQACDFIHQAALGLQHAHERGLVHRDIKPSNLLVTMPQKPKGISGFHVLPTIPKSGEKPASAGKARPVQPLGLSSLGVSQPGVVKVLDMGLALVHSSDSESGRWTQEGTLMGTPDYIAPEQAINSRNVDIRADLYSLGCTFYFLLAGKPPYGDYPLIQKLMMHQTADPRPVEEHRPEVPMMIRKILQKLLAKQPKDRFQTPAELAEALATIKVGDLMAAVKAATPVKPAATPDAASTAARAKEPTPGPSTRVIQQEEWAGKKPTMPMPASPPRAAPSLLKPAAPAAAVSETGAEKAKKICVLEGHRGWVAAVTFSFDRSTLASGGVDGALRLWDLAGSEPRDRDVANAHSSDLNAIAFADNNTLLATGSATLDGVVRLWDVSGEPPKQVSALRVGDATADCLAFSHDCRLLAGGGSDKHIHIWDVTSAEPQARAVLKGHTDFVKSVVFSKDSKLLASAGKDGTVRLWNLSRFWSKEEAVFQGQWGQVQSIAFSPDDRKLALGCLDQTVRIYDVASASSRRTLRGHAGVIRLVHYNPEGTLLSLCDGGCLILWDPSEGKKLHEWVLPRARIYSTAFTHDGRYLATGNNDGSVVLYRLYPKKADSADAPATT